MASNTTKVLESPRVLQKDCLICNREVLEDENAVIMQVSVCGHRFLVCMLCATAPMQDRRHKEAGPGAATRLGMRQCPECRQNFSPQDDLSFPGVDREKNCQEIQLHNKDCFGVDNCSTSSIFTACIDDKQLQPVVKVFHWLPPEHSPPSTPKCNYLRCDSGIGEGPVNFDDVQLILQDSEHVLIETQSQKRMTEAERTLFVRELEAKDRIIASLRVKVAELERECYLKNIELNDYKARDFQLTRINNGYDGSMIWKICQFNQQKENAKSEKSPMMSYPFYSGRYGYKMCLCLYIMGDGIGKGTHLSLFFVVMRGEFDNILQWPFTHNITFKLINQRGGRDIVDTFQPDPTSRSFRKPKSGMNIAIGCPRFISHTELERGGFIVNDTIFIKCSIDMRTIYHP